MPKRKIEQPADDSANALAPETADDSSASDLIAALFAESTVATLAIENFCIPEYLAPFYEGNLEAVYNDKRVTSASRDGGIYRLVFEDGSRAAVIGSQQVVITQVAQVAPLPEENALPPASVGVSAPVEVDEIAPPVNPE
jgi:hypothetical protein